MKSRLAPAALLAAFVSAGSLRADAACACCTAPVAPAKPATSDTDAPTAPESAPVAHPLRGVVVDILADKQALLVKHEEIPGVMRAMTMLLKVDAPTLAAAKKGQSITAKLVRLADGWWLLDVKAATPAE